MFNRPDPSRNEMMLTGPFSRKGYDWWWHSFTAVNVRTGKEQPFFIEFFLCNPALAKEEPVFGQLPENKEAGIRPSYLMVKAGAWGENAVQLHRFFSVKHAIIRGKAPFSIEAGDCFVSDKELRGSVRVTPEEAEVHPEYLCGAGEMSWNLTMEKKAAYNVGYGAGRLFRTLKAFEMYWHAEGMASEFSGTVFWNGEEYRADPETSYGYADKNWGSGFTSPWVWLASSDLTSRLTGEKLAGSAFDIGGGRPKVFGIALERKLLSAFLYKGREYEFNFSKFWTGTGTRFSSEETEDEILWHVRQENLHAVMDTQVSCKKKDMLLINYEAPDGSKRHNRLWNGGNGIGRVRLYRKSLRGLVLLDDIDAGHIGCEYGEYDS